MNLSLRGPARPHPWMGVVAAMLLFTAACAGTDAIVAESELPVASVAPPEPTAVAAPEPTATEALAAVDLPTDAPVDLSGFPNPRHPSFTVPRTAEHEAAGIAAGESVSDDAIVVVLGYSTTRDIFQQYEALVAPDFRFVSAAAAGVDIEQWAARTRAFEQASTKITTTLNPEAEDPDQSLDDEVEVLLIQTAIAGTANPRVTYVRALINETIREATIQFPNLKQIYVFGREFGGWVNDKAKDGTGYAGEPGNWANSFAIDLAVQDNANRSDGIWVGQGPYLWANGDTARADGLTWPENYFKADGRHLTRIGAGELALMIHEYFLEDPTAPWYQATVIETP